LVCRGYGEQSISRGSRLNCLIYPIQIWDLFEGGRLFRAVKDGHLNDEQHLAEMVSLMGQPSRAFLERGVNSRKFWDSEGELDPGVTPHLFSVSHRPLQEAGLPQRRFLSRASRNVRSGWREKTRRFCQPLCEKYCAGIQRRGRRQRDFSRTSF
jgi:hypothetical protein